MTSPIGLDTSVAIPLLVQTHRDHVAVTRWWDRQPVALCGHALIETYSVLTRLPGDVAHTPADAARLIAERFGPPFVLSAKSTRTLPATLASHGVVGGATYDALVALASIEHGVLLATRDARARIMYERLGAQVLIVA